jgi:hypothetical protein
VIAVVAPPSPLTDALLAELGDAAVVLPPDDLPRLVASLDGVERMFVAIDDDVAAADVVAAAAMAHVYRCVSLGPVDALTGSSVRSTILLDAPAAGFDPHQVARLAARELTSD